MLDNFQPSTEYTHTRYIEFARLAKCSMNYSCNSDVKHLMSTVLCSYLFILLLSYVLTQQQPNVVLKSWNGTRKQRKARDLQLIIDEGKTRLALVVRMRWGYFPERYFWKLILVFF